MGGSNRATESHRAPEILASPARSLGVCRNPTRLSPGTRQNHPKQHIVAQVLAGGGRHLSHQSWVAFFGGPHTRDGTTGQRLEDKGLFNATKDPSFLKPRNDDTSLI